MSEDSNSTNKKNMFQKLMNSNMDCQLDKLNQNIDEVNKNIKIHHFDLKSVGILGYAQRRRNH